MDTFTELLHHDPVNVKVLLDSVRAQINTMNPMDSRYSILAGWEEILCRVLKDVVFDKNKLSY